MQSAAQSLEAARRWFAEELRHVARVRSPAVLEAFATVPREYFAGAGPWRLLSPWYMSEYWTTEDADPRHLYHDVLIAIDPARRLNNGQPSLWAFGYDQLDLAPGEHVVHVGIGTGYYSAILAQIVGRDGMVTAVEIDAELAERARANLAVGWPQANVVAASGFDYRPERPADAIIVNAGVTHLSTAWLDSLAADNGRLLVPLTAADRFGAFVLITRQHGRTDRYAARYVCRVGIIDCIGGRDPDAESKLMMALRRSQFVPPVQSLRRPPEEPDDSCWLAGDGWWLSMAPVEA
jgi:protein-L-isoaspartate(D-aspartate) O-methyltransferase